jgi:hypothetical protein
MLPIGRVVGPADVAALAVHIMTNTAVSVQSLRPQASAGNGSPRVWAVISSLR